jgi:hypothetical protein
VKASGSRDRGFQLHENCDKATILRISYYSWSRRAHLNLSADFLDLVCLFFELRNENTQVFLGVADRGFLFYGFGFQLSNRRSLGLDLFVLFDELVK